MDNESVHKPKITFVKKQSVVFKINGKESDLIYYYRKLNDTQKDSFCNKLTYLKMKDESNPYDK